MSNKHISLVLLLAACGDSAPAAPDAAVNPPQPDAAVQQTACERLGLTPAALRTDLAWYGTNRSDLQTWIDAGGCKSPSYDPAHKPVATFDWDNTISKQDFGDAMTYWFIAHGKVLQPPNKDWHATSAYLTDAAATALTTACGTTVAAGQPLPTDTNTECADEMLSIYDNEVTRGGAPAFGAVNLRRMEAAYAWTPQLMAGYTHAEVQAFAQTGTTAMLNAAIDATQVIGTTTENGWLRINEQQKDLIHALQTSGFEVWIITASPQDVIGAMAPSLVGVPFDHVVGIRSMTDSAGKLTYAFEGCGTVPDNQMELIPTLQGKRCFINKVIYGETTNAFTRRPDGQRPYFASADTDSDVEFMRDAKYKLVINRNKPDIMCHAYYNENDSWRVNPLFIEPKPMRPTPYPCSTTAFTTETGGGEPTRDEGGNIIPDQADTVH